MGVWESVKKRLGLEQKAVIVKAASLWRTLGEPHEDDLQDYEKYYRQDPVAKAAVDFLTELIAGVGYYTTAEDERAKQVVDRFAEQVNLDEILVQAVRSMLIYGDAYIEKVFKGKRLVGLQLVPSSTMRVKRDRKGRIVGYVQQVQATKIDFKPEEILQLSYCRLPGEAYGISMLKPVLSMLKTKESVVKAMDKILNRYAAPKVLWKVPTPADAERLKALLNSLQPDEDPIISGDVQPNPLTIDPRARFEFFYDYLDRQIFEGLKAPLLSWLRNATEASAKVMLESIDRHVAGVQRYVKRRIEAEVFRLLVEAEGLSEVPRLNWGMPRTKLDDLSLDDIGNLVKNYVISPAQAQVWLAKLGFPVEKEEENTGEEES